MMDEDVKCRKCGSSATEEGAEGVCPKCFLAQAMQQDSTDTEIFDESVGVPTGGTLLR